MNEVVGHAHGSARQGADCVTIHHSQAEHAVHLLLLLDIRQQLAQKFGIVLRVGLLRPV